MQQLRNHGLHSHNSTSSSSKCSLTVPPLLAYKEQHAYRTRMTKATVCTRPTHIRITSVRQRLIRTQAFSAGKGSCLPVWSAAQPACTHSKRSRSLISRWAPERFSAESNGSQASNELVANAAVQQTVKQQENAVAPPEAAVKGSKEAAVAAGSSGAVAAAAGESSKQQKASEGQKASAGSVQMLHNQLEDITSRYQELDDRLDHLENTLVALLSSVKEKTRSRASVAQVAADDEGGGPLAAADSSGDLPDYDIYDDGEEGEHTGLFDLKRLQSSLSENINKGYLESVKHLREMLLAYEWHLHGKELAERRGVAKFEQFCAEHDIDVPFESISQLYEDPSNLAALPDNKTKLLARSIIQQSVDERYCSIYFECTTTAKELAHTGLKDVIPDSAGKVGGVIKDILPLPGFLKKG
eukprot:GHRR01004394.1.p1 GENE.GHRR01004394.1~~GHRR01004394.1.p1  ORF type:complete len:413 (+),score=139.21 GHRR01004394.1:178-1416(+)